VAVAVAVKMGVKKDAKRIREYMYGKVVRGTSANHGTAAGSRNM
jgi:hypothetical protein